MKKIMIHHEFSKERIWSTFCSKDLPQLSDDRFVKILFHKGQKTYRRYKDFYFSLGTGCAVGSLYQIKTMERLVRHCFDSISEILLDFRHVLERVRLLKYFQTLLEDLEELSLLIWKDIISLMKFTQKALTAA